MLVKTETLLPSLLIIFFLIIMSPLLLTDGFWKSLKSFKISEIFVINSSLVFLQMFIPVISLSYVNFNYGRFKQSFIHDVYIFMNTLVDQINKLYKYENAEDNLYVKNIIVNKDKSNKLIIPYIATERWIGQLGDRLQIYS